MQRLGEDVDVVAVLGADVGQLRVDRDRRVRDERPRGRGPDQQLIAGLRGVVALGDRQPHVHRRIDHVLIDARLPELVARQRHLVAGAVGDDLELLVQQALVVDRLERPPDRLDVLGVERAVGVVEVDPESDPLGHRVPVLDVAEDLLAAAGVELRDPEPLDVVLGGEAELGLERELDRQPVAVPAALALDEVPAHRAVAREDVLEHARQHVVEAGRAVRGRRALVEAPAGSVPGVASPTRRTRPARASARARALRARGTRREGRLGGARRAWAPDSRKPAAVPVSGGRRSASGDRGERAGGRRRAAARGLLEPGEQHIARRQRRLAETADGARSGVGHRAAEVEDLGALRRPSAPSTRAARARRA